MAFSATTTPCMPLQTNTLSANFIKMKASFSPKIPLSVSKSQPKTSKKAAWGNANGHEQAAVCSNAFSLRQNWALFISTVQPLIPLSSMQVSIVWHLFWRYAIFPFKKKKEKSCKYGCSFNSMHHIILFIRISPHAKYVSEDMSHCLKFSPSGLSDSNWISLKHVFRNKVHLHDHKSYRCT